MDPKEMDRPQGDGPTPRRWTPRRCKEMGGPCLRPKLVSEDLERTQVISHDNHALGTAHAFARVTAKTGLPIMHQLGAYAQRPRWLR